jgi:cephalosporin hydroxylase
VHRSGDIPGAGPCPIYGAALRPDEAGYRADVMRPRIDALVWRLRVLFWTRIARRPVSRLFHEGLIIETDNFASTRWLGGPIWQNVLDLWTIQEAIADIRPALLIEIGTNRGGSARFYAHLMDMLGEGRVLTVDIERLHDLDHPRIEFLHGDSVAPEIAERVQEAAREGDGPVMVILDGEHARDHVAQELELYGPLVTPGSVLLSQDGVIDELWMFKPLRPGPLPANDDFMARHPEFAYDRARNERFPLTHHPRGWMRRRG